jgi:hypothetical protein
MSLQIRRRDLDTSHENGSFNSPQLGLFLLPEIYQGYGIDAAMARASAGDTAEAGLNVLRLVSSTASSSLPVSHMPVLSEKKTCSSEEEQAKRKPSPPSSFRALAWP